MPTETQKRQDTMSILTKLRPPKKRMSSRYEGKFSEEPMPEDEEEVQDEFENQKGARVEQSLVNEMPEGVTKDMMGVVGDVGAGPTGMSKLGAANPGMVPYSPEEYERRSSFSKMEMPRRKKKPGDEELADESDIPADVNAAP